MSRTQSAVITRYSFHHFLEPEAVLNEMVRVCRPGGRVAVVDVFMSTPEQSEAYNRMEKPLETVEIGYRASPNGQPVRPCMRRSRNSSSGIALFNIGSCPQNPVLTGAPRPLCITLP